jgi:hypothetical protein
VKWLRGDRKEPIAIPKARTITERGLHTLIVPEATESEKGTYVCRAINAYGQVDMSAMVDVISPSAIDGGKPATFISRPAKKSIDVTVHEDVSISFRVHGIPRPRGKLQRCFQRLLILRTKNSFPFLSSSFFSFFDSPSFHFSDVDEGTDGHHGWTEIV